MSERPNDLDVADGLVNQARLLTPGNRLQTEHGVSPGCNKVGHQQGQGRDADNH